MNLLKRLGYQKEDRLWLAAALNRRAAEWLQVDGQWESAAACWAAAGDLERAADAYLHFEDPVHAAPLFLALGRWDEAVSSCRIWLEELMPGDHVGEVRARLGLAAALSRRGNPEDGDEARQHYRQARAMIEAESGSDPLRTARCWEALGDYGVHLDQLEFVQIGYEQALYYYGERYPRERSRVGQLYWKAVERRNPLLAVNLAKRMAEWDRARLGAVGDWMALKKEIEAAGFLGKVPHLLSFSRPEIQLGPWNRLAAIEDHPDQREIDAYLRSLTPPGMEYVPAGTFLMGSLKEDVSAEKHEQPQHELDLPGYYLSKRLVTNGQYQEFIRAGGYQKAEYWGEALAHGKWRWGVGVVGGYYPWRLQPAWWPEAMNYDQSLRPVVGVNWYEATAYCRWRGVRLPTEAEWEKAVSWDGETRTKRRYPWGDEWDDEMRAQLIRRQHKVWCSTAWADYPYNVWDGREGGEDRQRVVRGADFEEDAVRLRFLARCTMRAHLPAVQEALDTGFRVAVPCLRNI